MEHSALGSGPARLRGRVLRDTLDVRRTALPHAGASSSTSVTVEARKAEAATEPLAGERGVQNGRKSGAEGAPPPRVNADSEEKQLQRW